ncbi:MAG: GHKL domain-containing protein [Deltaproteobacteria bacterium]|jgi:signal transduction histidine kinase|nr:GHKL domain-containing protein [Deltaproteobacteria bacterium]
MEKNTLIRAFAYIALCLLALLGNIYSIPFFFGVDFIFGSIFVFIIFGYFGFYATIPAMILSTGYTYILWNHPYAIIIFVSEFLIVALLHHRYKKNIIIWDVIFWIVIGIPMVFIFYRLVMVLPGQSVVLIMLKQSINGIFNIFLAYIIIHFLPPILKISEKKDLSTISFRTILFTIMLLSLSVPSLVVIVFLTRSEFKNIEKTLINDLNSAVIEVNGSMEDWLGQKTMSVRQVAKQLNNTVIKPSDTLQNTLNLLLSVNPDFHNMYVANRSGVTKAFYPPVNEKGESTIGLDFSDRAYYRTLKSREKFVISDVFQGRGGVFLPIVTISASIYQNNQFNGFTLAALKVDYIRTIIQRIANNHSGQITLIDSEQKVIASTTPSRAVLTSYKIDDVWKIADIGNGIIQGFRMQDAGSSQMKQWSNSVFIKKFPAPVNPRWTIIVEVSTQPHISKLNSFHITSLAFLFILSVGSILLSSLVSSGIVRPLLHLQNTTANLADQIENAEMAPTWKKADISSSSMEVAQLGQTFNSMLIKLEKAQNELIVEKEYAENQARLAEKMALFAQAFPFPILSIDLDGKIETANAAADSAFHKDVKGLSFNFLFPNLTDGFLNEIRKSGEIIFQNISIGARYFLFTFQLVKQFDIIHVFGTDISKLRQAEEKAHEKQLWEALYHRAGEILHEVGNKTLILVGYLDEIKYIAQQLEQANKSGDMTLIMKLSDDLNPEIIKAFETLNVIQEIVDRMSQRKRNIIEKWDVNIFTLVRNSIEDEKYKAPTVDFILKCPEDLKEITCHVDEIHISQILTNILKNAEHAIRSKENQVISVDISARESCLTLDIIDNGTGIPKEIQSKIFEDGFTTKGDEGKGIGLALCQNLARENDGTLELAWSNENEGSDFRLTLNLNNENG